MDEHDVIDDKFAAEITDRYDRYARELPQIDVGTAVRVQDPGSKKWDCCGTVICCGNRRDYRIKMQSGRVYWRNRRFIRLDHMGGTTSATNTEPEDNNPADQVTMIPAKTRKLWKVTLTEPIRRSPRIADRKIN